MRKNDIGTLNWIHYSKIDQTTGDNHLKNKLQREKHIRKIFDLTWEDKLCAIFFNKVLLLIICEY